MSDSRINEELNTKPTIMEKNKHYGNEKDLFTQVVELALKDIKKDEFEAYRQQQERKNKLKTKP